MRGSRNEYCDCKLEVNRKMESNYARKSVLSEGVSSLCAIKMDADAQEAELQSIEAIFPDYFNLVEVNKVSLRFGEKIRLDVVLPPDYPSMSPPKYTLSCPTLKSERRLRLQNLLEETYLNNVGEPVLFAWITVVQELMSEMEDEDSVNTSSEITESGDSSFQSIPEPPPLPCPPIKTGEIITDRKSVFQAHIAPVKSKEEVKRVMEELKSNNKIARATHNIVAYRIRTTKNGQHFQIDDCEDDGEHGASSKMLAIIRQLKANSVIVVVSRWYGGVHLGPDRFRIINNLTREMVTSNPEVWINDA